MRRADRLFQIVQILRNKRLVTAKTLAERLEVSERTIYRDIQDLSLSGVPVEGEAGVGYMLRHSIDIPPIMFTSDEIEALVVGARMVKTWAGIELGYSAQSALDKITAVIPAELRTKIEDSKLFSLRFDQRQDLDINLDICRKSIDGKRLLQDQLLPCRRRTKPAPYPAAGPLFLGKCLELGRLVRTARRFPQFQAGSDSKHSAGERDI